MSPFAFAKARVERTRPQPLDQLPPKDGGGIGASTLGSRHTSMFSARPNNAVQFQGWHHALHGGVELGVIPRAARHTVVTPASSNAAGVHGSQIADLLDAEGQDIADHKLPLLQPGFKVARVVKKITGVKPTPPPLPPRPIKILDKDPKSLYRTKFRRVKDLESGGEGKTILVKHKTTKQLLVLKTVRDPETLNHVPFEAGVLSYFNLDIRPHPHLINFETVIYSTKDIIPFAEYYMPYFPLGDLCSLITSHTHHFMARIPESFIWRTFEHLSSAIDFLHRGFYDKSPPTFRGLVHRDIKPENILLRATTSADGLPDLLLADFGHATFDEFTYTPCGTPMWKAPELPRSSPKGDVWAVGAVVHCMAHLAPPIAPLPEHMRDWEQDKRIWHMRPEARQPVWNLRERGYSEELEMVMERALRREEARRVYARDLLGAVQRGVEGTVGGVGF